MSESILIRHGTCVLPNPSSNQNIDQHGQPTHLIETPADLFIRNGKIEKIGVDLKDAAEEVIEARGLHILPGVIDTQVHFRDPGHPQKEDLESGSRAALLGGVTGFFDMPNTSPSTVDRARFQEKIERAKKLSYTNYAFYIGGASDNIEHLAELEKQNGCCGIKVFVGSSTGTLLVADDENIEKILRAGSRRVIFHSEDEYILQQRKQIVTESHNVAQHHVWRNVDSALSSTRRILNLAQKTGRPVHILHVTSAEEMQLLGGYKKWATVEVLPQHLTLSAPECYERLGTLAQQNPPIREKYHQDALWKGINEGTVDILGSDHAPHTLEEKSRQYPNTPSGVPGVQTMLPLMLNHMNEGRLSLTKLVQLMCEAPRKVFGLKDSGRIEVGASAQLTIVDLKRKQKIENKWIASRCGWTPFDGMTVQGWPVHVILNGQCALFDGAISAAHEKNKQTRILEFDF